MITKKRILISGGLLAALAVALGAFGAHALKALLVENNKTDTFELGVKYQFYHSFALLLIGVLWSSAHSSAFRLSAIFFTIGIILFSGSLYALAIFNTTHVVLITPVGGVCFIAGWVLFIYAVWKSKVTD
jgi:uncharacterized membrane protein YgdD (TMEM256/DUF423 family)